MKSIIKQTVIWVAAIMMLSVYSCDFLNVDDFFNETLRYDSIFSNKRNMERYMWASAALFPDEGNFSNRLGSFACDEGFSLTTRYQGSAYVLGNITPTNVGSMSRWTVMYQIIRRANTIIANIDVPRDISSFDKREILGYTYFMRAYAYYQLFMNYGPLVIIGDEVMDTNETTEYYDRARATLDETVDYICAEMEKAAAYLPGVNSISYSTFGRPINSAAYGLIARLRLIQASPLWNGGTAARRTFGFWRRSTDNVLYVSQNYDETKWAIAAMASKRIIDTGDHWLHTVEKKDDTLPLPDNVPMEDFPLGAGNIDAFRSYDDIFTGEALPIRNREYLWARISSSLISFTRDAFVNQGMNGNNSISIPQKIVDAYLMADGQTINDSSDEYPYAITGFMSGADITFSRYTLKSGVSNMYVNRELRFYSSIGFHGRLWPLASFGLPAGRNVQASYFPSGNGGKFSNPNSPNNYPITGYTLVKYTHEEDSWGNASGTSAEGAKRVEKAYPIIRYAEILLSYVEALNNLNTTHTVTDATGKTYVFSRDQNQMAYYFNMVRFRAGLPGLTPEELASRETMQALIERERMVEFLFENIRYFDVRRWGLYEISENEPILGLNTDVEQNDGFFSTVPVNHSSHRNRVVDRRLVLFPIHLDEVRKSPSLDQNPGWQY